jgi:type I restriction enzyme M protein
MQDDGEPFAEKMDRLAERLTLQFAESATLEETIRKNLATLQPTTIERID